MTATNRANPSTTFHLLQYAGVLMGVKSQLSVSLMLTFILLVVKKSQSDNLLRCVLFDSVAPVVTKFTNVSKGVVVNWELARTNPDEIKENIPSIINVQRIVVKRNNVEVKTNTLISTFNSPKIPESLKVYYLNIQVSQFVVVVVCHDQVRLQVSQGFRCRDS